jgi:outer membrane autotransporter protein
VIVEPGFLPNGSVFPIITAGGISGTLTPVVLDSLTLSFIVQDPPPPTLELVLTRDYTNPALDLNWKQAGVGAMLNGVSGSATGDLAYVLGVIDLLPTAGAVGNAFQQISPEKAQALSDLSLTAVRAETQSLSRRMTNLRYDIDDMGGAGGAGSYNLAGWSVFVDPSLFAGTRSTTMDRTGYDFSGEGFTMGMDRKVADNLLVGLAAGYTHANAYFSGSGGSADLDLVPISLYAAYMPRNFYIFGTAGYALNLYDLNRQISFSSPGGSVSRAASSSPLGNLFNIYGEAGYDVKVQPVVVTPIVSMSYSHLGIGSFTETGAGSLDLNVSSQSIDSAQSGIGVRIAAPATSDLMKAVPQAFATWQHEFCNGKQDINASLMNTPGAATFGWETEGARGDFANVGGDLTMFVRKDLSIHFSYNAVVGGGDTTHIFSAGVRWQF